MQGLEQMSNIDLKKTAEDIRMRMKKSESSDNI